MSELLQDAGDDDARRRRADHEARGIIARCGFFDAEWYRARYITAAEIDLDPLDHYLMWGVKRIVPPGPLFDSAAYLEHAWHLIPGRDDPLAHFLFRGAAEGRVACPVGELTPSILAGRPIERLRSSYSPAAVPTVAAVVHAFHPDLFAETCSALAFLPAAANVLVSTDDEAKAVLFRRDCDAAGIEARLEIAVTPNRGRNFGPMLVRFREAVRHHDLLLHVHTKKTDYRGAAQRPWRQRLLRSLLPSAATVSTLIRRFAEDPRLGVLTAAPGETVRYWAYNWLSNRPQIDHLLQILDLELPTPGTMFDYPVGGMFWARTDAIRPLMNHDWQWHDFPVETGQLDGTIAHAIERAIILMARTRNYRFDEIDYLDGIVRCGWSSRSFEQYRRVDHGALLDTILRSDVISFGLDGVLRSSLALFESHLEEYASFLIGKASLPAGPDPGTSVAIRHRLVRHTTYARPSIMHALAFARSAGRRVVLVNNRPRSLTTVDMFLDGVDLRGMFDAVYDRDERGIGRDDQALWSMVARSELIGRPGGGALAFAHIGADAHLEIQKTADLGLSHFHVLTPVELLLAHDLYPHDRDGTDPSTLGDSVLLGSVAKKLFADPFAANGRERPLIAAPEDLGFVVFGPMLFAFIASVIRQTKKNDRSQLHFLAREGWFLGRLYTSVTRMAARTDVRVARYFHCSRRCVLSALQADGIDVEPVLQGAGFRGTIRDLLSARLGVEVDPDPAWQQSIELPRDRSAVRRAMDILRRPIITAGREQLSALSRYLAVEGMSGDDLHALVDIGYSATVQDGLQRLLGVRLDGLYMGVSHAAARVGRSGGHASGCFVAGDADLADFTGTFGLMLEAFLTAPHGQVVGYTADAEPRFRDPGRSQASFPMLERIYRGVEDYASDVIAAWGPEALDVSLDPRIAISMMRALREGALELSTDLASTLSVEDDFCGMGEIPVFRDLIDAGRS